MSIMPNRPEFFTPNSNLTPTLAGGVTAAMSLPLIASFESLKFPWVALGVSLVFAVLIVLGLEQQTSRPKQCLYCILNTLLIFSVAYSTYQLSQKPPQLDPISKKNQQLACKILDQAEMSDNDREFIKNLIFIDTPETSHISWIDSLKPSQAWAQVDHQTPSPSPQPGGDIRNPRERDAPDQGDSGTKAKPKTLVSTEELMAIQDFRRKQQEKLEKQKRYNHQSTF